MALMNNISSMMLKRQPYTRQSGVASGLGQKQPQTCPTGYRWNAMQGKCVPTLQARFQGFMNPTMPQQQEIGSNVQAVKQYQPSSQGTGTSPTIQDQLQKQQTAKTGMSEQAKLIAKALDTPSPTGGNVNPNQYSNYATLLAQAMDAQSPKFQSANQGSFTASTEQGSFAASSNDFTPQQKATCIANKGTVKRGADGKEYCDFSQQGGGGETWQSCGEKGMLLNPATGQCIPNATTKNQQEIDYWTKNGGQYLPDPLLPNQGTGMPGGPLPNFKGMDPGKTWSDFSNWYGFRPNLDPNSLIGQQIGMPDIQKYLDPSAYTKGLQGLATQPLWGGQTLEQLEQARIDAMKKGTGESFNLAADEMTKRLNQEAAAKGMFSSGARMQNIQEGLGDLSRTKQIQEAQQEAAIRGERPGLLLQQAEQQRKAFDTWGQLDQSAKQAAVEGMLGDKKLEYDKQFNDGTLRLEAFKGNLQAMGMYLDNILESAKTEADYNSAVAKIYAVLNQMTDEERNGMFNIFMS